MGGGKLVSHLVFANVIFHLLQNLVVQDELFWMDSPFTQPVTPSFGMLAAICLPFDPSCLPS